MDFMVVIPVEVIEHHILPELDWNDLLRLRRVSKISCGIIHRYLRVNPHLAPELEINDGDHSFGDFLQIGIPSTRIFINNSSGYGFFGKDNESQAEFLRQFGPLVKHLRMNQLSAYVFGGERDFLEALVNLETLHAECIGFGLNLNSSNTVADIERAVPQMLILANQDPRYLEQSTPHVFGTLKVLKIDHDKNLQVELANLVYYSFLTLRHCMKLDYARLPFNSRMSSSLSLGAVETDQAPPNRAQVFLVALKSLEQYIITRRTEGGGLGNLKVYDFANYHDEMDEEIVDLDWEVSPYFLQLCALCKDPQTDVKLMNVGATWFLQAVRFEQFNRPDIGNPVVSLVCMDASAVPMSMPNLETIDIRATSRSYVGAQWRQDRQEWPALKSLHITVDSKVVQYFEVIFGVHRVFSNEETTVLFQFFFQGILRAALTELNISFAKGAGSKTVPNVDEIVASCPNLKKLTLGKWAGTNKALTKLWSGLPGLEEISLENCKKLGNVAFVGEDQRNPVFFKLKNLRKLSLKGLDQMPKITDTLLSLVLRHLKLTHLILTSDTPVKSVTSAGVLKLLEGGFAESIEKFPFTGWSLADVSAEEFRKLGTKFRSYNML